MANLPDHPQNTLMCQHTHERVGHCQPGCPDQAPLEPHHIANDQHDRPPDRGGDETEPPPPPEDQAEQNECRDHSDSFRRPPHHLSPQSAGNTGRLPSWRRIGILKLAQASRADPHTRDEAGHSLG